LAINKKEKGKEITKMLDEMRSEVVKALPNGMDVDHFLRVAQTVIKTDEKLLFSDIKTIANAIMKAAQLGLEINSFSSCYLMAQPVKGSKVAACKFQVGYRGIIELIRRSNMIDGIWGEPVFEKDEFDMELGSEPFIKHRIQLDGDRGKIKLIYCVAQFKSGNRQFTYMRNDELEKHRDSYSSGFKYADQKIKEGNKWMDRGPWETEFVEQAKKTVLLKLSKFLPLAVEIQGLIKEASQYIEPKTVGDDWPPKNPNLDAEQKTNEPHVLSQAEIEWLQKKDNEDAQR